MRHARLRVRPSWRWSRMVLPRSRTGGGGRSRPGMPSGTILFKIGFGDLLSAECERAEAQAGVAVSFREDRTYDYDEAAHPLPYASLGGLCCTIPPPCRPTFRTEP